MELGWSVLPLHFVRNGRCSCGRFPCGKDNRSAGKHPYTDLVLHGVHQASKDPAVVQEWFSRVPTANIGIATGEASGFDVVDLDPRNGSEDTLAEFERTNGKLPDTATQLTGGEGSICFSGTPARSSATRARASTSSRPAVTSLLSPPIT